MHAPRRRRWPWLLGALALSVVVASVWVNRQLEPNRLAATVLGKAGQALQLKLSFRGTPDYAFKPEPRLVLPGFSAAGLDGKVFLSARRAEISLPWDTVSGGEPVITRIELDSPVLNVAGLQRWLASRPPTPFKLPTLTRGLAVSSGTVIAESYSLHGLSLELPHLQAGDPARVQARGTFVAGKTSLPFQLEARAQKPGLASPLALDLVLTRAEKPVSIALRGAYSWADPRFSLVASHLSMRATSPLPTLEGKGKLVLAESLQLELDAILTRWPEAWPKLPAALAAKSERLPVRVEYRGKPDFSDSMTLVAGRDDTELRAQLRVPEMRQWLASEQASPLPPLQGTLKTPALEFEGIELRGVQVEISAGGDAEEGESEAAP